MTRNASALGLIFLLLFGCRVPERTVHLETAIPAPGSMAPDFTLPDVEKNLHSLSASFQNVNRLTVKDGRMVWQEPETRPVCLILGAQTCKFTLKQIQEMKTLLAGLDGLQLDTYAVLTGAAQAIQDWAADQSLPFPLLLDEQGAVSHGYGVKMTPDICLVDAKGVMVYRSGGGFLARADLQPLVERLAKGEPFEGVALPDPGEG